MRIRGTDNDRLEEVKIVLFKEAFTEECIL